MFLKARAFISKCSGKYLRVDKGVCPICESAAYFRAKNDWLRDSYKCMGCRSIPRQRALVNTLNKLVPAWKEAKIHESSPNGNMKRFFSKHAENYSYSHYFPGVPSGTLVDEHDCVCQDLQKTSFADNTFDIIITQDVLEHIFPPEDIFKEISRILKPGGIHIFTVPYTSKNKTGFRVKLDENGLLQQIKEAVYHGNPVDQNGSLVTIDWGEDICSLIAEYSGMSTSIYLEKNESLGIDGEYLEVFVSRKDN